MMRVSRRRVLATTLGFPALLRAAATQPLEDAMQGLLQKYQLPGGALGIARAGKIVYTQGFGLANRERHENVQAGSRFRLASVTKPFTAAAILRLVEQGKLALDDIVLPKLHLEPLSGSVSDSRWHKVTVKHLLQHTGGWDKAISGDAMFKSPEICRAAGIDGPADGKTTVRWMLGRPLDYDPGTRHAYCNFGYCVLGRLIEAITGQPLGVAMRELVFDACDAKDIALGHTLTAQANEVSYYTVNNKLGPSVFPPSPAQVPLPYGSFALEANDANGGLIANVSDVLRFLLSMDEASSKPLLRPSSLKAIYDNAAPGFGNGKVYYSLGWLVRPQGQSGRPNIWHNGSLPGTTSIAVRLGNGVDWVALFNARTQDYNALDLDVQKTIHTAIGQVTDWPG